MCKAREIILAVIRSHVRVTESKFRQAAVVSPENTSVISHYTREDFY